MNCGKVWQCTQIDLNQLVAHWLRTEPVTIILTDQTGASRGEKGLTNQLMV